MGKIAIIIQANETVNNGLNLPLFDGFSFPLLGIIKQGQRPRSSTGLSSGMNLL